MVKGFFRDHGIKAVPRDYCFGNKENRTDKRSLVDAVKERGSQTPESRNEEMKTVIRYRIMNHQMKNKFLMSYAFCLMSLTGQGD